MQRRIGALAGIAAPVSFVAAWAVGSVLRDDYSPVHDTISHLAEAGAPTRPLMQAGFVTFGVLLPVWAHTLGDVLDASWLRRVVTVAGVATLGVAAFPVTAEGGTTQDTLHALAAGTGYLAMAATPLVAVPALRRRRRVRAARASLAVGAVSVAALVTSLVVPEDAARGALQRVGLTVVDAWHVVAAGIVLARR